MIVWMKEIGSHVKTDQNLAARGRRAYTEMESESRNGILA